ncbi:aminopeptidase PepB [Pseudaeromonas sharmana]|uniref:Aminopeptidase PepB n=1 Tax=Pseudaeromonas sharmana TaxID=328412 RepID=A0ABV8CS45_9GAMM
MQVQLSPKPAPAEWGEAALLSHATAGWMIHHSEASQIQQAARRLANMGLREVQLTGAWTPSLQWAFAQGFMLSKGEVTLRWADAPDEILQMLEQRLFCANWVRKLTNASPDALGPLELALETVTFLSELAPGLITHRLLKGDALLEAGWVGLHAVGRAGAQAPVMLELDFNPTRDRRAPVSTCLVGKGITFDSGGYSLKSSEGMLTMKSDMGGAALLAGALGYAITQGLTQRVKLILCCAENLVNEQACKLGEILHYRNGVSVEIVNTDAEGRLVLADGLLAAVESGATRILDAATLTGAAYMALGGNYHAIFALDKPAQQAFLAHAERAQEPFWSLPLEPWHRQQCPSHYADTANSRPVKGGGPGGASNAAGFLSRFVPADGAGWLHLDLAAAFCDNGNHLWAPGATALGMVTLANWLQDVEHAS